MKASPYLVFSIHRSGSTSLISSLNLNHNVVHEPLTCFTGEFERESSPYLNAVAALNITPTNVSAPRKINGYPSPATQPHLQYNKFSFIAENFNYLKCFMDTLFASYRGIKHVWNTLSLQGNLNLLKYAKEKKIKVVFLTRNPFEATLSNMIANQVKVHQLGHSLENKTKVESFSYQEIPLPLFVKRSTGSAQLQNQFRSHFQSSSLSYLEVTHDSLFPASLSSQKEKVQQILTFLEFSEEDYLTKNLENYLFNKRRKQSGNNILKKIPNYAELQKYL